MKARRLANAVEQASLGCSHPYLAAAFEPGKQGRTAPGIEVGCDLVQQQQRRLAATIRDQLGMGEDKPEQQPFLLAGRRLSSRHLLGAVVDGEVLPVRACGRFPMRRARRW